MVRKWQGLLLSVASLMALAVWLSYPIQNSQAMPNQQPCSPPAGSAKVLGNIAHLLEKATPVDGSAFKEHPATCIAVLPGGELYFEVATMDIDDDGSSAGSPPDWAAHPVRGGKIDKAHQTQVSYSTTPPISAFQTPYFALPGFKSLWWKHQGLAIGDGAVIIRGNDRIDAVFADTGPDNKIGEMSIEAHRRFKENVIVPGRQPKLDDKGDPVKDPQTGKILTTPALVTRNSASKGPFVVIVFPRTSAKRKFVTVEQSLEKTLEQQFLALSSSPSN